MSCRDRQKSEKESRERSLGSYVPLPGILHDYEKAKGCGTQKALSRRDPSPRAHWPLIGFRNQLADLPFRPVAFPFEGDRRTIGGALVWTNSVNSAAKRGSIEIIRGYH